MRKAARLIAGGCRMQNECGACSFKFKAIDTSESMDTSGTSE